MNSIASIASIERALNDDNVDMLLKVLPPLEIVDDTFMQLASFAITRGSLKCLKYAVKFLLPETLFSLLTGLDRRFQDWSYLDTLWLEQMSPRGQVNLAKSRQVIWKRYTKWCCIPGFKFCHYK